MTSSLAPQSNDSQPAANRSRPRSRPRFRIKVKNQNAAPPAPAGATQPIGVASTSALRPIAPKPAPVFIERTLPSHLSNDFVYDFPKSKRDSLPRDRESRSRSRRSSPSSSAANQENQVPDLAASLIDRLPRSRTRTSSAQGPSSRSRQASGRAVDNIMMVAPTQPDPASEPATQ